MTSICPYSYSGIRLITSSNQERGSISLASQLAINDYIMEALMADASFPLRFHRKLPSKYM